MKFFTSDQHYYHHNIIKYCNRPFTSIQEMNETLIENHNKHVKNDDEVYFLGDFGFSNEKNIDDILTRLNGKKYIILGNHDATIRNSKKCSQHFVWLKDYHTFRHDGTMIVMCHFPFAEWDGKFRNSLCLHGHSHNNYKGEGRIFDVGVDSTHVTGYAEYRPFSIDELIKL